jgi:hypothetical protein
MAKYTENQAKSKARMVVDQVGRKILAAVAGTNIDPAFLAGKIGVEAGVRGGKIIESATRFESGVFQDLKDLRDKGWCIVGGKTKNNYSGVSRQQIMGASEAALKALATSYGLSQIMGWHMINNLKGTISDLRDPDKHLIYTIKLMELVTGQFLTNKNYEACLRIWNTGKPTGKTYDPNYVFNALQVMKFAKPLLQDLKAQSGASQKVMTAALQVDLGTEDPDEVIMDAREQLIAQSSDFTDQEMDEPEQPAEEQADEQPAADQEQDGGDGKTQQAENIINLNDGSGNKDPNPPAQDPETKTMNAPPAEGIGSKVNFWLTALGLGVPSFSGLIAGIKSIGADGQINWSELLQVFLQMLMFILPYLIWLLIAYVIYRTIKMILIQISFIVRMWINGDTTKNDIKLNQPAGADAVQEKKSWIQSIF